ncbi:major facilitator superfamily domain-containing protein [Aspergillus caelatus]|uniref:Major facilitator superfamily domain-containing protein n=2 Tax=Aspergillus subgen. Circumdati TaxID=2720871 RepID=A0A5N7A4A4_9EURO|nr:major facilitator superfamily domain-containing protein [Aspergillus caelatus]KAE8363350.1 major facilitator superfamily domain-containing protein [Aspergillus caelatus]KAE8414405.1 major facilitator superfamily domain-containing protein [Aspergillus pseudocaelatus]
MSYPSSEKDPGADTRIEDINQPALNDVDYDEEYTYAEQRKIIHRVDRRLVTITGLAYCVSLMDRTNLSMAAVAGMTKDLGLTIGSRYSVMVLIFFVPYVIFQPPMTVITRKIGPTYFLGTIVILWGAILVGMGFARNWKHMVATRALLGLLEAGYFPGCVYLLSSWYTRFDVQKRFSVFYLIGCVASALSGILAFGLMQMGGLQDLEGWRWIFIMEGVITGVIGLLTITFLVDFPDKAHKSWRFLSEKECAFIVRRINRDRSDGDQEPFSLKRFLSPALDLKIWGFAMVFFCTTTVTYAIAYFLPIILEQGMGFSTAAAQCLIAPPFAFAGIVMYASAWVGDKYRLRGAIVIFNALLCIIGLPIMGFAKGNAARYVGVFFAVAGANSNIPACMAYQANNVRGQWTRAFSSATLVGFGGIGGIVSSLVFRSQDAPGYRPGMWTTIACNILILFIVASLSLWFRRSNREADRGERVIEGSPEFRYTI